MRLSYIARRVQSSSRPRSLNVSCRRNYAVQQAGAPSISVFSNEAKQQQRSRAATDVEESRATDYLRDEVAMRLTSRLLDINRTFDKALDFGANACNIARILTLPDSDPDSAKPVSEPLSSKIGHLTCADSNQLMLHRDENEPFNNDMSLSRHVLQNPETLPFEANSFDLVLSS
ncbi:S-adenosyl-L-methionine-dependent methyltransferase, partial [Aureobasidium melanogenum]